MSPATTAATPADPAAFERCLAGLEPRVPAELRATWREETRRLEDRPATGAQLLEALQQTHRGLGVAIGRGETGEDERYELLRRLVAWLRTELGRAAPGAAVRVRPATVADADALRELAERTFRDAFAEYNTAEDMQAYVQAAFSREQVAAELRDPASAFLLALASDDGAPVGYAKLRRGRPNPAVSGPEPVELQRLYVDRAALGGGVGAALMQAALAAAGAAGHRTMWLAVWEHNGRARAFYERWEFQPVGEQIFRLGSDDQRDVVMARPLA